MERWEDETDEQYADRGHTARQVAIARARYAETPEYQSAMGRTAEYNRVNGMEPDYDSDDIDDLREQLGTLRAGINDNYGVLNAGIADNTATLRAGLGMDTTPEARAWAEAKLKEEDPYAAQEQELTGRYGQVARSTVDRLRAARAKLADQKVDKTDFWLAFTQGAAQPNQGGKLGWTGNIAEAVRPALAGQRKFLDNQQAGLDAYDTDIEAAQLGDAGVQLRLLQEKRKAWADERLKAATILGKNVPGSAGSGTSGAGGKKLDQTIAGEFMDWATKNGPVYERSVIELNAAMDRIKRAQAEGKNVSGRDVWSSWLSLFGDAGEKLEAIANPLASDIRNTVLNTVQQTLRPTLGSQFTEREGARVLARAYDPFKPEEVNIARIQALMTQIQKQAATSRAVNEWFLANDGDMSGFKLDDAEAVAFEDALYKAMDAAEQSLGLSPRNQQPKAPPKYIREKNGAVVPNPAANGSRYQRTPTQGTTAVPPKKTEAPAKKQKTWRDYIGFAEGGAIGTEMDTVRRLDAEGNPTGETFTVPAGMTDEELDEFIAQEEAFLESQQAQQKEAHTELGKDMAGAMATGIGTGAVGATAYAAGEALDERIPWSLRKLDPGQRRTVDFANEQGFDFKNAASELRKLRGSLGVPATALDTYTPEMRGLVNQAMRSGPNDETARLQELLSKRNNDARANRLPGAINQATAADPYLQQQMDLEKARSGAADPLYSAMEQQPWFKSKNLDRIPDSKGVDQDFISWLNSTKPGAEAITRANTHWKLDKKRAGSEPTKSNKMQGVSGYHIKYLDQIKQELGGLEAAARSQGDSQLAGAIAKMRTQLVAQIDKVRPDYAAARGAFQDHSKPLTALAIGRGGPDVADLNYQDVDGRMVQGKGYLEMSPDEAKRYLAGIGGGVERENLRSGVAEALNRELRGTAAKSNPATALLENPDKLQRLQLLLDAKDYKRLVQTLEAEAKAWDTSSEFGSKTQSARSKAHGAPVSTTTKVKGAAKKAPGQAVRAINPFAWLYKATVPSKGSDPTKTFAQGEAGEIVRTASGTRAAELERLAKAAGRRKTRGGRSALVGALSAAAGTGAALYNNMFEDEEQE